MLLYLLYTLYQHNCNKSCGQHDTLSSLWLAQCFGLAFFPFLEQLGDCSLDTRKKLLETKAWNGSPSTKHSILPIEIKEQY